MKIIFRQNFEIFPAGGLSRSQKVSDLENFENFSQKNTKTYNIFVFVKFYF